MKSNNKYLVSLSFKNVQLIFYSFLFWGWHLLNLNLVVGFLFALSISNDLRVLILVLARVDVLWEAFLPNPQKLNGWFTFVW